MVKRPAIHSPDDGRVLLESRRIRIEQPEPYYVTADQLADELRRATRLLESLRIVHGLDVYPGLGNAQVLLDRYDWQEGRAGK